jgi:phage terminase large subunit
MGAGVIDRLRQLGRKPVEINFCGKSGDPQCKNKRAEMWWRIKKFLELGGALPDDSDLVRDLISQEYFFDGANKIQLVSKDDMKRIGLTSPDDGDGVALTFAGGMYSQGPEDFLLSKHSAKVITEYNVLG